VKRVSTYRLVPGGPTGCRSCSGPDIREIIPFVLP
jgi:hypothetical protein